MTPSTRGNTCCGLNTRSDRFWYERVGFACWILGTAEIYGRFVLRAPSSFISMIGRCATGSHSSFSSRYLDLPVDAKRRELEKRPGASLVTGASSEANDTVCNLLREGRLVTTDCKSLRSSRRRCPRATRISPLAEYRVSLKSNLSLDEF